MENVDLSHVISEALSWLNTIIWAAFGALGTFVLSFFPDADSDLVAYISQLGDFGSGSLSFNFLYFMDFGVVGAFVLMTVLVIAACFTYSVVKFAIWAIHKVLDSIPIIG